MVSFHSLSGRPLFSDLGVFRGYLGTGRDITTRRSQELVLANRTLELAAANRVLEEEVKIRERLERDFILAVENEMAGVGFELHDNLGQALTGIALSSGALANRLRHEGHPSCVAAVEICDLVNHTIRHMRMISHGLSPYIWGTN